MGRQINLTDNTLNGWHKQAQGDANQCWYMVMQDWMNGQGLNVYEHTWNGLTEILEDAGFEGVVPNLQKALDNAY